MGKTLSFYLPAFLSIAESIDSNDWTRCLAIYPRNELLKDQLAEAYGQARKIDSHLKANGKRKLTIATLFGATPENEGYFDYEDPPAGWTRTNGGDICPFLTCPTRSCQGQMVWRTSDRNSNVHRLCCSRCSASTAHDELILTRQRLQHTPADILFTTTEMLNQRIGDSACHMCSVFGVARNRTPKMVLLDEVHTYSGISGAQTAMLLRRWKHAGRRSNTLRGPVSDVGRRAKVLCNSDWGIRFTSRRFRRIRRNWIVWNGVPSRFTGRSGEPEFVTIDVNPNSNADATNA